MNQSLIITIQFLQAWDLKKIKWLFLMNFLDEAKKMENGGLIRKKVLNSYSRN